VPLSVTYGRNRKTDFRSVSTLYAPVKERHPLPVRCRLDTESDGSRAGERGTDSSSNLHDKLGRLTYHVTHKLAEVITRLNDWQRTLDDMLQVSDVVTRRVSRLRHFALLLRYHACRV